MITIDTWLPDVLAHAPGCPRSSARREILHTLRDFCKRTWIWQEPADDMPVSPALREYDLESPYRGARVLSIIAMQHGDTPLEPIRPSDVARTLGGTWRSQIGQARFWMHETPSTFRLIPQPNEADPRGLTGIVVALEPVPDAEEVGDILYDEFDSVIVDGSLSRILMIRGQEWYDPKDAGSRRAEYEYGVSRAKLRAHKAFTAMRGRQRINKITGMP